MCVDEERASDALSVRLSTGNYTLLQEKLVSSYTLNIFKCYSHVIKRQLIKLNKLNGLKLKV